MYKIHILSVGKSKDSFKAAIEEYLKRMSGTAQFTFTSCKDNVQLLRAIDKEDFVVCLDAAGEQMTSERFAGELSRWLESGGSRAVFVIGGAEGLPIDLKKNRHLLSLSAMTFPHQLVPLLLVEQIYRAFEIVKGTGYHK